MARITITALGNAGFRITGNDTGIIVDPFFDKLSRISRAMQDKWIGPRMASELIIVTHDHWDHFSAEETANLALAMGSVVVGPATVTRRLAGRVGAEYLCEMEPASPAPGAKCAGLAVETAGVAITAYRTFHSKSHNSYLVNMQGFRFFNDGDNEHTQCLDQAELGDLDAVMLCPWKGSGWVGFLDALKYRRWFLMHLDEAELDQQERGEFFNGLCDHVPANLVCLRTGESTEIDKEDR